MKYRRLRKDELEELKPEFVEFLASNQIEAKDWERIKKEEIEKAERLIDIFSDIVFEKILSSVHYLEQRSPGTIRIFKFDDEQITMNGIMIEDNTKIDFTENQTPEELIQLFKLAPGKLKIFTAQKSYSKDKLTEIYDLMQKGCLIVKNDQLFQVIEKLKNQ
ncbi:DUF6495 family protein [Membranihabitans maritimus]|uniref:DUF6495 family protein n=1 Tax=Membranihabitans maritimus TaxID=2904244 RepID=UPI001F1FABE4|nr:DUF6495 family protein [Membranihabitans maritimus]